jgi:hypothetical protein
MASNNGRHCNLHACCGDQVKVNDLIHFKLVEVLVEGKKEDAIQATLIRDGVESCVVGYLPRNVVVLAKDQYNGRLAQIVELYKDSDNSMVRKKHYRNKGMASFHLVQE